MGFSLVCNKLFLLIKRERENGVRELWSQFSERKIMIHILARIVQPWSLLHSLHQKALTVNLFTMLTCYAQYWSSKMNLRDSIQKIFNHLKKTFKDFCSLWMLFSLSVKLPSIIGMGFRNPIVAEGIVHPKMKIQSLSTHWFHYELLDVWILATISFNYVDIRATPPSRETPAVFCELQSFTQLSISMRVSR